jgi:hypothetical protein
MARLLEAHDLADTSTTYRWGALWCLENEAECGRVLDALPEGERAFHNFPPHIRGLIIIARAPRRPGETSIAACRPPDWNPSPNLSGGISRSPVTMPLRQAAADAIETYSGRALPATVNRRIGGRVTNQLVEAHVTV